jgi:putative transposase
MNRASDVVQRKREWHYELTSEARAAGFRGWHSRGYLPHFDAPGIRQFITYRLADSVPAEMREEWAEAKRLEDDREKFRRMEQMLDRGGGACDLGDARVAELIEENLWFHDGKSYRLLAWVIMPNHVHILAEMWKPLGNVVKNWKSYTASKANGILGRGRSPFWQADYFDRYTRNREQYLKVVKYIEDNPVKAGLVENPRDWPWSSARFRGKYGADEMPSRASPELRRRDGSGGQGCPRSERVAGWSKAF